MNLEEVRKYKSLDLLARQVVEGFITGMHKSPFHGFSVEFAEHRPYNIGENTRNIDWKLYAKTNKLYVKRFDEETNLRCHLVIDTSSSMFFPKGENKKIKFAAYAAASLAYLLKKQRDAFGLSLFSDTLKYHSEVKSSHAHFNLLLNELDKVVESTPVNAQTNVAETLHLVASQIHKRSLVVLFTDMFEPGRDLDPLFNALQHLKHKKHEVVLFHTLDGEKEMNFDYDNRPLKFVDTESNEEIKLYPHEVQEVYKEKMKAFYKELKDRCGMYKIDFVKADVNKDFSQVLLPFLLKRQKMT